MILNSPLNEPQKACLVGIDDRHTIELRQTDTFIGRSRENDVVLVTDLSLSRRHAVITKVDGTYYLRDLRSSNGSLVNGIAVEGMVGLKPNDELFLGRSRFLFCPTAKKLHDTPPFGNSEPTTILANPGRVPAIVALCRVFVRGVKNMVLAPEKPSLADLKFSIHRLRASHTEELLKGIQR